MAVRAELFDGTILEFPDGTDPAVIQSTAKRLTTEKQKEAPKQEVAKESSSTFIKDGPIETFGRTLRQTADIIPAIGQGALGLLKAGSSELANIGAAAQMPGATKLDTKPMISGDDFTAGREYLQGLKSAETQLAEQKVQEAQGFLPTLGAYAQNPSAILTGFGESVPAMVGGAGIARGLIKQGAPILTSAAIGEGSVGSMLTAEQIREAQGGEDLSAAQRAISIVSGILTGGLGVLGGKVAQKLGVADIDVLLAAQKSGNITPEMGSKVSAALKGAIAESVFEELPQSIQEQISQNLATGRPWDEGVGEAAASGLAVAAIPGAGAGYIGQARTNKQIQVDKLQQERATKIAAEDAQAEKERVAKLKKAGKLAETNVIYEEKLNKLLGGEPNVSGTDTTTAGTSTDLSGQPDTTKSDTGTGATVRSTVDGTGKPAGAAQVRTDEVPAPLEIPADATPELTAKIEEYNKRQEEIAAGGNKNKVNNQIKKNEKLLAEIKAVQPLTVSPKTQAAVDKLKQAVVQETTVEEAAPVEVTETPAQTQIKEAEQELAKVEEVVAEQEKIAPEELDLEKLQDALAAKEEVTTEAQTPTAPQAQEVVTEAQPEELRRFEESYKVKTTEAAKKDQVTEETIEAYDELSKQDTGQKELPAWGKLNTAEKAVYTSTNKAQGPDAALKALRDFRYDQEGNVNPPKEEDAALYEVNREAAAKEHGIDMPKWHALSPESQEAFLSGLPKLTRKKTAYTGADLHGAFGTVATQLEQEGKGVRGASPVDIERAKLAGTEQEAQARAQAEIEQGRAAEAEAVGKGEALPDTAQQALQQDGINGVLDYIATQAKGLKDTYDGTSGAFKLLQSLHKQATSVVFQRLARVLSKVDFQSNIVTDPNDAAIQRLQQEGKLAEYDPKTDTFYFTPEGMDEATILHEVVHAATVKLISQAQTSPESLTGIQKEAVEHLNKLFTFVQGRLGSKYPNAVENVYEFVAYAMTDTRFQEALANLQVPRLSKYTAQDPELKGLVKSAWGQFTQVLSKMYNLVKPTPTAYKVYDEIYGPLAKEFASTKGSLDELYKDITDEDLAFEEAQFEEDQPKAPEKFTAANKLISIGKGYEGNILLEVSEVMNQLLAAPEAGIDVEPLAAKAKKQPKKAAGATYASADAAFNAEVNALNKKRNDQLNGPTKIEKFKSSMSDKVGTYRKAVKLFQNVAEPLKRWHNRLDMAGKIIRDENRAYNNVYEQLVGAGATAQALYGEKVQELENTLTTQLTTLTNLFKTDAVDMLNKLQMFVTALHEPERRRLVFLKKVPLRDDIQININGVTDTPNNFREYIFSALNNLKDTPTQTAREQAIKLRQLLDSIVFTNTGNLEAQEARDRKGTLNTNNIDFAKSKNKDVYNEDSDKYIVEAGYDPQRISQYLSVLNNSSYKQDVMDTLATVKQIEDATIELNKLGNYWSRPVDNRVAFYGFKHYVPFKGKPESAEEANRTIFQPNTEQTSRDLQYYMPSFEGGRASAADNPIAQVVTDAKKAAFLAANNKVTQALANAVAKGQINTVNGKRAPTKIIPFEERYKGLTSEEIKAKNTVFNYKDDGTIEVYALKDQGILESLRQPYKIWGEKTKAAFRTAGAVTRFVGQGYTRFNPFFAPWNAFRDTLTNLYNLNVDRGLVVAGKTLTNTIWYGVFDTMMGGGMITSARVTRMYNKGNIKGIEELAKNDKFAQNFLEYVRAGGVVTYLQGVSNVNQLRNMEKTMQRGSTALTFDQLKDTAAYPFDMWFNGFENTARIAAYGAIKDGLISQGISEQEAIKEAAIATKELANFEQSGKYGSEMGSLYMFARAQATGAVRAIDSLSYIAIPVEKAMEDLPDTVKSDPAAMAKFKEEYSRRRVYSAITAAALFGMGYMSYMMALSGSGDDDQGENIVEKDDLSRWTRAMRFTIPGTDYMFQLPWGFGKGAFSAWGAQVAAYVNGSQSLTDMLGNSITIGMDSFIPVPASRIPVTKDIRTTGYSLVDTVAPTVTRPVWEWFINTNGLGMEIQNLEASRGGKTPDAFISRANIPQYYKDTTEWLFENTDGKVDVSPDIMHFFASSYMNGISLLGQNLENAALLAAGDKEFNAKTDTIILNSFIGTRSDYYSREFNRVEEKIKEKKQILGGFETLDQYNEYTSRHPYDEGLVQEYEQDVNGELKGLRSERKRIMNDRTISNKERTEQLKDNKITQQYVKAQFIAKYKSFDESLKTSLDKD
jgi:hypothetical protein